MTKQIVYCIIYIEKTLIGGISLKLKCWYIFFCVLNGDEPQPSRTTPYNRMQIKDHFNDLQESNDEIDKPGILECLNLNSRVPS